VFSQKKQASGKDFQIKPDPDFVLKGHKDVKVKGDQSKTDVQQSTIKPKNDLKGVIPFCNDIILIAVKKKN
jgi:hypothetical protein